MTLIDTSFFVAFFFANDVNHQQASNAMNAIQGTIYVAAPVLPELFYMIASRIHYRRAIQVLGVIRTSAFTILDLNTTDLARMQVIMTTYHDAAFDFADVAQMALAERHNIQTIYTYDRRDFSIFRPAHAPFLNLLP